MSIVALARPEIRALNAYSSARDESARAAIMLDANESPRSQNGDAYGLNRYPDGQPRALVEALASFYGVPNSRVLVGRGSDEPIDLLVRAFCRAERHAVAVFPPTFGMYAVAASIQGAEVVSLPVGADFAIDVDATLAVLPANVRVVFVCSPNNPTGTLVPLATIDVLAAALADRALLVVDEAYIEFADAPSATSLLDRHDNLAVLRTLSKAWALAGARVGALIAREDVVSLVRKLMPPYPLPTPSVAATLATLSPAGVRGMRERVAELLRERERLARALRDSPAVRELLPSAANFVTARFGDAATIYRRLSAAGIVVRDVSRQPRLAECLRITIGAPHENARVLAMLAAEPVLA